MGGKAINLKYVINYVNTYYSLFPEYAPEMVVLQDEKQTR